MWSGDHALIRTVSPNGILEFHNPSYMMISRSIIFVLICSTALIGCSKDNWDGYVYPDKNNLSDHIYVGRFDSLEACRDASVEKLRSINALNKGDYECGRNCKNGVCKETSH